MRLPPLRTIPLILRPQAWLHRRHYGEVLSPIRWWGRIPLVFYLVSMFVGYLERKRSPLDPVLRSLVTVRVSQINWCAFCVDINSATGLKRGISDAQLFALTEFESSPLFDARQKTALAYAEAMTRSDRGVDDALMERLKTYFDDDAIIELTALIAFQNMSSKFNAALAVAPQGFCRIPAALSSSGTQRHDAPQDIAPGSDG